MLNPETYRKFITYLFEKEVSANHAITTAEYGVAAVITMLFPIAGLLADIKCGRHKTIIGSLCLVVISLPLLVFTAGLLKIMLLFNNSLGVLVSGVILSGCSLIAICLGVAGFMANVVQSRP